MYFVSAPCVKMSGGLRKNNLDGKDVRKQSTRLRPRAYASLHAKNALLHTSGRQSKDLISEMPQMFGALTPGGPRKYSGPTMMKSVLFSAAAAAKMAHRQTQ